MVTAFRKTAQTHFSCGKLWTHATTPKVLIRNHKTVGKQLFATKTLSWQPVNPTGSSGSPLQTQNPCARLARAVFHHLYKPHPPLITLQTYFQLTFSWLFVKHIFPGKFFVETKKESIKIIRNGGIEDESFPCIDCYVDGRFGGPKCCGGWCSGVGADPNLRRRRVRARRVRFVGCSCIWASVLNLVWVYIKVFTFHIVIIGLRLRLIFIFILFFWIFFTICQTHSYLCTFYWLFV